MLLNSFKFGHDPDETALAQEMMRRQSPSKVCWDTGRTRDGGQMMLGR